MEINVEQSKLAKALSIVSRITGGSRTTLPILNNVLMEAKDNKVTLVTTNLDMAINYYLPTTLAKDGKITVPAKLLADFVSNLPKGEVKIQVNQEKLTVSEGKYKSVFNGNAAEDFPELPEFDEKSAISFQMGIDDFRLGMNAVKIACSSDTTRPTLTGIYFNSFEGGLYVAATDGYRLAEKKLINKIESEIKAIVPVQCIVDVLGAISDNMENIEILFIDAMSTDKTTDIIQRFISEDTEFRSIRLYDNPKKNQASGFNLGIKNSNGDLILKIQSHRGFCEE